MDSMTTYPEFEKGLTLAQKFAVADDDAADRMLAKAILHDSDKGTVYEFVDGSFYIPSLDNPVFVSASELRSRLNEF